MRKLGVRIVWPRKFGELSISTRNFSALGNWRPGGGEGEWPALGTPR